MQVANLDIVELRKHLYPLLATSITLVYALKNVLLSA
jgi:hypothetical protein